MPGPTASAGEQTSAVNRRTNRIYRMWQPIWTKLAHVREGIGGFLDGSYLVEHPREFLDHTITQQVLIANADGTGSRTVTTTVPNPNPKLPSPKLLRRRRIARYENFGGKIIDQMKAALFREEPIRRVGEPGQETQERPIEAWWKNIERRTTRSRTMPALAPIGQDRTTSTGAARTSIRKFWPQAWDAAATFGHMFVVMDRPVGPSAPTQADQSQPFLRMYTPLDAVDWLLDDQGNLVQIKFLEMVQRTSLEDVERVINFNIRTFTETYWALYSRDGVLIDGGPVHGQHQMGRVPVVVLYAKRRNLVPLIGHSVLDDPQMYVDVYNLTSEIRELLRNQTFGILNVQLGAEENLEDAKTMMGSAVGSENVLFSRGKADYISPAAENIKAHQEERTSLIRMIYRLSAIAWEADMKDAEAHGSLKLKREDLNQMLSAFADELERSELEIAELFYRATYGPDAWEARMETDQVVIRYPETFDSTPFDVVLAQAEAALALGMPPSFSKELKKRLVVKFLPDLPQKTLDQINTEIDNGTVEPSPLQKTLAARLAPGPPGQPASASEANRQELDKIALQRTTEGQMTKVEQAAA